MRANWAGLQSQTADKFTERTRKEEKNGASKRVAQSPRRWLVDIDILFGVDAASVNKCTHVQVGRQGHYYLRIAQLSVGMVGGDYRWLLSQTADSITRADRCVVCYVITYFGERDRSLYRREVIRRFTYLADVRVPHLTEVAAQLSISAITLRATLILNLWDWNLRVRGRRMRYAFTGYCVFSTTEARSIAVMCVYISANASWPLVSKGRVSQGESNSSVTQKKNAFVRSFTLCPASRENVD